MQLKIYGSSRLGELLSSMYRDPMGKNNLKFFVGSPVNQNVVFVTMSVCRLSCII